MDLSFLLQLSSLFLTLSILLYLVVGDNALFRLVTYAFIGVAAGYVFVLVIFQVLVPRFFGLFTAGSLAYLALGLVPFLLGVLLFFKLSSGASALGTLPLGILVGIGAAVAIGGAIFGTLFGQVDGTLAIIPSISEMLAAPGPDVASPFSRLLQGLITLVGVIATLAYFQFSVRSRKINAAADEAPNVRRTAFLEFMAKVGQIFIGITLGAVFAGVFAAAISAMVERIGFIFDLVASFVL